MLLIPCPWCGPRNQIEFTYGGDATVQRPANDAPIAAWFAYVYLRDNPMGPHDELWLHSGGCRSWFKVRRDTRTHDILASARIDEAARRGGQVTQAHRLPDGGIVDRTRTAALRIRRRRLSRVRRRHAGFGAARQRHSPRRPQLQVSPAARHLQRRHRGAECAGATRARRAHGAERARDDARALRRARRRQPELLAVGALRRRRDQRRAVAAVSRRFLLQDVHVAAHAPMVAALRARDPPRGRHGPRGGRARSRPLRASVRALRRAGDRRRRRRPRRGACRGGQRCARDRVRRKCSDGAADCRMPTRGSTAARPPTGSPPRRWSSRSTRMWWRCLRTTAFGYYDGNLVGALERVADHLARAAAARPAAAAVEDPRAGGGAGHRRASSAPSPTPTTTCPARCSPAPPARM